MSYQYSKPLLVLLQVLMLFAVAGPAVAAPVMLVDREVSATPDGTADLGFTSASVAVFQGFKLEIAEAYTITEIEVFASNTDAFYSEPYTLAFSIQELDGQGLPLANTSLFSSDTLIEDTSTDPRWLSSGDVEWLLDTGTYWVTFKSSGAGTGTGFSGAMPFDIDPIQGLETALRSTSNSNWSQGSDDIVFGVKVHAETTVVPVPAAVWLFGSALAGLGWMRRKRGG